jgi:hypothetical protein
LHRREGEVYSWRFQNEIYGFHEWPAIKIANCETKWWGFYTENCYPGSACVVHCCVVFHPTILCQVQDKWWKTLPDGICENEVYMLVIRMSAYPYIMWSKQCFKKKLKLVKLVGWQPSKRGLSQIWLQVREQTRKI